MPRTLPGQIAKGSSTRRLPRDLRLAALAHRARELNLRSNKMRHLDKAIALYDQAVAAAKELGDEDTVRILLCKTSVLMDTREYLR